MAFKSKQFAEPTQAELEWHYGGECRAQAISKDSQDPQDHRWELITLTQDCMKRSAKLTDWEQDFILSNHERLMSDMKLSPKQEARLHIIWEKATKEG